MADGDVDRWLKAGITAVKGGDSEQAHQLFLKVLEKDDENESAWLWLSSVVESEADKRVCLENVLTINPDNAPARLRLKALDNDLELQPPTPARQPDIIYKHEESFDDVWSRNVQICGYCAAPVGADDNRCPQCKRNLLVKIYRYAMPTVNLTAVWVGLLGLALLYGIQFGYGRVAFQSLLTAVSSAFMILWLVVLTLGVYLRKPWAHTLTLLTLILIIILGIAQFFVFQDFMIFQFDNLDPFFEGILEPITNGVWIGMKVLQLIVAAIVIAFTFRAGPDFERKRYRNIAAPTRGLKRAIEYQTAARKLAEAGLWATAVMDWQRAVALDPNRVTYQKQLGQAYAHLGFFARSLDVFQGALQKTKDAEMQADLNNLIQSVREKQTQTSKLK